MGILNGDKIMLILENFGGFKKKLNLSHQLISIKNENKTVIAEIVSFNGLLKLIQTQSLLYFSSTNNNNNTFIIESSAGSSKSAQLIGYTMDTTKGTITIHAKL